MLEFLQIIPAIKEDLHLDDGPSVAARLFSETRPIRPFVFETSMLNNFGLKALSTFLHVPFLCLKNAMDLESQLLEHGHIVRLRGVENDENARARTSNTREN